ncbi:hypothetical protein BDFB_012398 [Asbolus verrucosus]|uniref:Uncharacterized protein n=1 Tax=Asbolus verrucosus TaxID=1661398 RepID=A0A482W7P7_ASBVE|nr:hypothetical protein BDFB_012398 [Asbolus verrucosus]
MLERVKSIKDLGVVFDSRLCFVEHYNDLILSAHRTLGFIIRNSRHFKQLSTLFTLFDTFVRSKLENACVIWDPHSKNHIDLLESVQRKLLKYICYIQDGVYPRQGYPQEVLLSRYNREFLAVRRLYFSAMFLYKVLRGFVSNYSILEQINFHVSSINLRNQKMIYLKTPRINLLKFSPLYGASMILDEIEKDFDLLSVTTAKFIAKGNEIIRHVN